MPLGQPSNLVPVITQTAIGKIKKMTVFGTDYETRDGSCIRDFIHVSDLAHAHTLALKYLERQQNKSQSEIFNLGTGNGVTVLEAIQTFEKVSGMKLNFEEGSRRAGDVVAIYANNDLAKNQLGWETKYHLDDIIRTAWNWEQKMKQDEAIMNKPSPGLN